MQVHGFMRLTALVLGITSALAMADAQAAGFQIRENSVRNLGRGFAGSAVANDPSVVTNNPAAMVNIDRPTVRNDLTVIDLTAEFEGGGTTAVGTPLTGSDGGDPGDPTAVPALSAVFPMTGTAFEGLTFGASVSAPFGLKTEYEPDFIGRYNAIESDVRVVDLTLSAALAVTENFSVGAGLIYEHADVTLSNAIDFGTAICAAQDPRNCFNPAFPFRPQANDGTVSVNGTDTSFGWVVGMQWKMTEGFVVGLNHRGEVEHELGGEADFTVPGNVAAVVGPNFRDTRVNAPLTLPAITTLSVQANITDDVRLMADIQRTGWDSLEAVRIFRPDGSLLGNETFDWQDSTMVALGGEFDLSPALTLRAGVAMDETPTNDEHRTPRLPDEDRMIYSIGATWHVSSHLAVDAAFMRIELDESVVDATSSSRTRLRGSFDGYANLFGIAAQMKF